MKRVLMNRLMVVVAAVCLSMGGLQLQASACGGCGGCGFNLGQWFRSLLLLFELRFMLEL